MRDQNVLGLEVPVDDAPLVQVSDSVHELRQHSANPSHLPEMSHGLAVVGAEVLHPDFHLEVVASELPRQTAILQVFQQQIDILSVMQEPVGADYVGVLQRLLDLDFRSQGLDAVDAGALRQPFDPDLLQAKQVVGPQVHALQDSCYLILSYLLQQIELLGPFAPEDGQPHFLLYFVGLFPELLVLLSRGLQLLDLLQLIKGPLLADGVRLRVARV